MFSERQSIRRWLLGALLAGALVRLPGVAWGVNWPDGFTIHHPDEYTHIANADAIISPLGPATGVAYPKAFAAYAATPFLVWYGLNGSFGGPRIHLPWIVGSGRLISVAFGLAAILLVFLIARDALHHEEAGVLAAWLMAFAGLHVSQSHFFLADTAAIGWTLLAVWLLWRDVTHGPTDEALRWAAFAAGAALAVKIFVDVLPAVLYVALRRPPRVRRLIHVAVFLLAAFATASLGFETPATFYRAAKLGAGNPLEFSHVRATVLAAIQLPALLSLPLLLLALAGTWSLLRRLAASAEPRRLDALTIFGSVPLIGLAFITLKLDPWIRHWLILVPWAAIAGGWALARLVGWIRQTGRSPAFALLAVFGWMAVFVVDGERFYLFDPRNDALRWLHANVPAGTTMNWMGRRTPEGYQTVRWFTEGKPDVLIFEMYEANQSLSGTDWRDSYPSDPNQVYDGRTRERVAAIQSLFRGTSDYTMVARFPVPYLMPEYRLADALLGDRARNYISEIVVFRRSRDSR